MGFFLYSKGDFFKMFWMSPNKINHPEKSLLVHFLSQMAMEHHKVNTKSPGEWIHNPVLKPSHIMTFLKLLWSPDLGSSSSKRRKWKRTWWSSPTIPVAGRLKQEDLKFKACLACVARLCQNLEGQKPRLEGTFKSLPQVQVLTSIVLFEVELGALNLLARL